MTDSPRNQRNVITDETETTENERRGAFER
jgi:hypothetical protein